MLPVLGTLLAVLLLSGGILAARGGARAADPAGRSATSVSADPAGAPATALPAAQAPSPNGGTPSGSADPFLSLRTLLEDRRVGPHAKQLAAELAGAQQALAATDKATAVRHYTRIQQILLAGTQDGTIDAGVMVEAMKRVQALAKEQGLALPLAIDL
jgi:hypothetical protein